MMNNQRSDAEKNDLIEKGKKKKKKQVLMKSRSAMKLLITVQNHKYKMKSYCLKCRKDTDNINPRVSNTSNSRTMILSKCGICSSK